MSKRNDPVSSALAEIDFVGLFYMLRSQAWVILACLGGALLLSGVYLWWAPKTYEGQAVIQVDQGERKVVQIEDIDRENLESLEALKTLELNLSSWPLLQRVLHNPELALTPAALGLNSRHGQPPSEAAMIQKLSQGISIDLVRGTRLMSIKADAVDPRVAGELPNALITEYKALSFETHRQISSEANDFLAGEVKRLSAKLQASKLALQDYRERTHSVSLEGSRNITDARLRELNDKVTEAKAARLKLESDYAQVQALAGKPPELLLDVASVANAPAVLEQKKNVVAQEAELANLSQRYKSKHPKFIQAQSRLDELRAGLDQAIHAAADGLASSLAAARATEQKFEEALQQQEGKSLELGRLGIEYETLLRAVDSDTALYQSVLNRMNETTVTENVDPENIRVITRSAIPTTPAKPRKKFILALAMLAGGLMGFGISLGRVAVDRSLHTVDQAESYLGLTTLSSIPREPIPMLKRDDLPIVREQHGAIAENFRTLRTALHLLAPPKERRTFLFTSAVPGEGKSFCAANLAIAFAQQGLRTLLIDADMRMPALEKLFFEETPHPGVADVLLGRTTVAEAVRPTHENRLAVLTAGHRPKRPAELLAGPRFGQLLSDALRMYERVVIDTAPVHAVSDTLLLGRSVDSALLVVRAARTPRKAVARARDKLTEAGAPLDGMVLNQLPRSSAGGYYYYSTGSYGEGVYGAPSADAP
jgi:capsular exopolysaccharide synthesis family protein